MIATMAPSEPIRPVTIAEIATRLEGVTLPGDGFADDLESIQTAEEKPEVPLWSS